jgi:signal peptidase I
MFSSIYTTLVASLLESISDTLANPVSVVIFSLLSLLIIALIIATFSNALRKILVAIKVLEPDEEPSSLLFWIIGIIIIVKLIQGFIVQPFIVDGGSMLPTYETKQFLLVDKFSYLIKTPARGDVAIFKLYEGGANPFAGKHLIKRVIGLPGERIVVNNGITTIYNKETPEGFVIEEPYVTHREPRKNIDVTLEPNHYFVMGDNRAQSYDSRDWGPLNKKDIKGQVFLRVYPLSTFSYEPGRYLYPK